MEARQPPVFTTALLVATQLKVVFRRVDDVAMVAVFSTSVGLVSSVSGGGWGVVPLISAVFSAMVFVYGDYLAGLEGLRAIFKPTQLYLAKSLSVLLSALMSSLPGLAISSRSLGEFVMGILSTVAASASSSIAISIASVAGVSAPAAIVVGVSLSLPPVYSFSTGIAVWQAAAVSAFLHLIGLALSEYVYRD